MSHDHQHLHAVTSRPYADPGQAHESQNGPLPNLFAGAPHELSHSAYLAWLLRLAALDAPPEGYEEAQLAGRALWEVLSQGRKSLPKRVETEVPLKTILRRRVAGADARLRLDVVAWDDQERIVAIETKVMGRQRPSQLDRYQRLLLQENSRHRLVPVSLSYNFDPKWLRHFRICEWGLGLDDLASLLLPFRRSHPIIDHHLDWMVSELAILDYCKASLGVGQIPAATVLHLDPRSFEPRLQWAFMQRMVDSLPSREARHGTIYNGTNRGGAPWTQYRFVFERRGEAKESVMLRLDTAKAASEAPARKLALELYTGNAPTRANVRRAQMFAQAWDTIAKNSRLKDHARKPKIRLSKERRVVEFAVTTETIPVLLSELPKLHRPLRKAVQSLK